MLEQVQNDTQFSSQRLENVFNQTFYNDYETILVGGAEEPLYVPARKNMSCESKSVQPARIFYKLDYFASALHEVAHWCVAGSERREQEDYGYWYAPDGRTAQQQALFERVEVKPQAMEWIFSLACGYRFRVSADNLEAENTSSLGFKTHIVAQAKQYCQRLPRRARLFTEELMKEFNTEKVLVPEKYQLSFICSDPM